MLKVSLLGSRRAKIRPRYWSCPWQNENIHQEFLWWTIHHERQQIQIMAARLLPMKLGNHYLSEGHVHWNGRGAGNSLQYLRAALLFLKADCSNAEKHCHFFPWEQKQFLSRLESFCIQADPASKSKKITQMGSQGICVAILFLGELSSFICLCLIKFKFDGVRFPLLMLWKARESIEIKRLIKCQMPHREQ